MTFVSVRPDLGNAWQAVRSTEHRHGFSRLGLLVLPRIPAARPVPLSSYCCPFFFLGCSSLAHGRSRTRPRPTAPCRHVILTAVHNLMRHGMACTPSAAGKETNLARGAAGKAASPQDVSCVGMKYKQILSFSLKLHFKCLHASVSQGAPSYRLPSIPQPPRSRPNRSRSYRIATSVNAIMRRLLRLGRLLSYCSHSGSTVCLGFLRIKEY